MKQKILVLSHSASIGGAELALASLIESTKETYEWHVVIADTKKASVRLTRYASKVSYLDLPWWCYEAHGSPKQSSKKAILKAMQKLELFAESADYLLTNTITVPWLSFVARKLNKPHVWYVHEFGDIDHNLQFINGYKASLETISNNATRVLTISTAVKQHLEQAIPATQIDLIHQAIDFDKLLEIPVKPIANNAHVKLLCIGAIKPSKGQDIAVAAAKLASEKHDISLDVVGPNANDAFVQELIKSEGSKISIQPRAYNIVTELSSHDVVLMCSSNEAMGRVTLEALAAGKIVVGYDCIATKELLSDNRGILYSPNELAELATAIIKSLDHVIDVTKNRHFVTNTYSSLRQADDFKATIANAHSQNEKVNVKGLDLDSYLKTLEENGLFITNTSRIARKLKKPMARLLPESIKKRARKIIR